ncbi:hypothetical protein JD844_014770 [Phrynosoma platyrhinos]|uniref:Inositol hexakisphosphate and diphosphoinositol-pentakisphosphate kinase n=1 Tax=Phrynosoma platyrhinos TaxID=52577 RepID=A0ABQ7SS05_PHRPL|nr:hypothetical protein JD844_014770 [Phrynosoma platyrhinos]
MSSWAAASLEEEGGGPAAGARFFVGSRDDEAAAAAAERLLGPGMKKKMDGGGGGDEVDFFEDEEDESPPERQIVVGICAMTKKSKSKPMTQILERLCKFDYITVVIMGEDVILNEPVENWPPCDCLISFHSKGGAKSGGGFPCRSPLGHGGGLLEAVLCSLFHVHCRREVYRILKEEGIDLPRYAVLNRDPDKPEGESPNSALAAECNLVEGEDHVEVNGAVFPKPFVEKPVSAEDHNVYIYYPTSAGGGSQRLFRKVRTGEGRDVQGTQGQAACHQVALSPCQEVLDIARLLVLEQEAPSSFEVADQQKTKLEQLKTVLEMYGHFSGINRKVQLTYLPSGQPKASSEEEGRYLAHLEGHIEQFPIWYGGDPASFLPTPDARKDPSPSLLLVLKWGGELTPAGRVQAEELGRAFRCMYPGGQGDYAGFPGCGLLRLHSTYRHDLKIYASDEGRVQMTAAAFAKVPPCSLLPFDGLLALEGELTPILVQMVKSANMNGLLDSDSDSLSSCQHRVKARLREIMQKDAAFSEEDYEKLAPTGSTSLIKSMGIIQNPVAICDRVFELIESLTSQIQKRMEDPKSADLQLYHSETLELMLQRWRKLEQDFRLKNRRYDISKIPDIYDCVKYDVQHNTALQLEGTTELLHLSKALANVVIPQVYLGWVFSAFVSSTSWVAEEVMGGWKLGLLWDKMSGPQAWHHSTLHSWFPPLPPTPLLSLLQEYGISKQEKLEIAIGFCLPLIRKIQLDLQRTHEDESVNKLHPLYSRGVLSPGRHVRTRLYFTSESHVHSLLSLFRYGGLLDESKDPQWKKAMDYLSAISELNYMTQIVVMLYEDNNKDPSSEERFHVELHFSPGVKGCEEDSSTPAGSGFRPASTQKEVKKLEQGTGQEDMTETKGTDETDHVHQLASQSLEPVCLQRRSPLIRNRKTGSMECTGLFSTSVLGGSSSAPNLQDYARSHGKKFGSSFLYKDGFEGCSMVPSIHPLETLHNSLSLRQVNHFLTGLLRSCSNHHQGAPTALFDPLVEGQVSATAGDRGFVPQQVLSSLPLRPHSDKPPWYSSGPSSTVSSAGPSSPTPLESCPRFGFSEKTPLGPQTTRERPCKQLPSQEELAAEERAPSPGSSEAERDLGEQSGRVTAREEAVGGPPSPAPQRESRESGEERERTPLCLDQDQGKGEAEALVVVGAGGTNCQGAGLPAGWGLEEPGASGEEAGSGPLLPSGSASP